jgi:putative FmdB family regulatory protein
MPLYQFECADCGAVTEETHSITETIPRNIVCNCGGSAKLIIGRTFFHLKGDGWARDGYGSKPAKSTPAGPPPT